MSDALIIGAIFLVIVLTTQLGVRRHNPFLAVMPFVTSAVMGYLVLSLGPHHYASGDPGIAAAGTVIGAVSGLCLNGTMTLYRDPARNGRLYTRGGVAYLAVWLVVLVGRIAFVAALEHSRPFAVSFGQLLDRLHGSPDGVGAFFLLMALGMSITRETALLLRARRIPGGRQPRRAAAAAAVTGPTGRHGPGRVPARWCAVEEADDDATTSPSCAVRSAAPVRLMSGVENAEDPA